MLTIGEENAVRDLKRSANTFLEAVNKLCKLESMKAANLETPGTYSEKDFLDLI